MGDGYVASEQNKFKSDATMLVNYMFQQSPWSHYRDYFNIFAIEVISEESGVKHPRTATDGDAGCLTTPISNPSNYFGSTFDYGNIHRLVVPTNNARIAGVLASNFPDYDQVIIVANSQYYGGSGGAYATSTIHSSAFEICVHEIGHSFANLADEYYAGDVYAREAPNMTQQANPTLVKWKNWMGNSGIGIYPYGSSGNPANWYRPHNNCKMQFLNSPFCRVCAETIIEKTHQLLNPVINYEPINSDIEALNQKVDFKLAVIKPSPNTLKITWRLDDTVLPEDNKDSIRIDYANLTVGQHTLSAVVVDTTELLQVDNHSTVHFSQIAWNINKSAGTGIKLTSIDNRVTCSVFQNSSNDDLNLVVKTEKDAKIAIQLTSVDGKVLKQIEKNGIVKNGIYTRTLNIGHLQKGIYIITFRIDNVMYSKKIIK
jgi:hypothetical protein